MDALVLSHQGLKFPVAMRLGVTPVLIPNTTVKTQAAEGTMLETIWENRWPPDPWGYSSVGRAPALQAGGQGFESLYLHCLLTQTYRSLKTEYRTTSKFSAMNKSEKTKFIRR